jgi:hypothetical protein
MLVAMSSFLTVSCSSEAEQVQTNKTSCLSAYITTPCDLLSKAEVADLAGVTAADIEMEVPEEIPLDEVTQYSRIFCGYRWPSDRVSILTIEVGGSELENEIPLDNVVNIGDIEVIEEDDLLTLNGNTETYAEYFHRVRIGDDHADAAMDGIGDKASVQIIEAMNHSNYNMTNFWVLHGNVNFNIVVDVSDSDAEDLALAKKLALALIDQCAE